MVHERSVAAPVFEDFLSRPMIAATKPVFAIVDGHPIHEPRLVKDCLDGLDGQLQLF